MNEIVRHIGLSIELSFGTITFIRDSTGTYALVDVALDVGADDAPNNKVNAALRLPITPDKDTVIEVVDKCRRLLAGVMKSSADYFDSVEPAKLLYREGQGE